MRVSQGNAHFGGFQRRCGAGWPGRHGQDPGRSLSDGPLGYSDARAQRHRVIEGVERPLSRYGGHFHHRPRPHCRGCEAIKLGAYDYITKPIDDLRLKLTIRHALEQKKLQASYDSLKKKIKPWSLDDTLVFRDRKMDQLLALVHTIADTMATVLITGESGTGKSMLAHYIHQHSHRREGPFVKISCGSLSETLLESELFGHVRGSFTGAIRDKKGKFEEANGGTIFLDDINSASPNLQIKFLRVLQEKVIERVGGNVPIQTDVRIITATNTSLQEEVTRQNFR